MSFELISERITKCKMQKKKMEIIEQIRLQVRMHHLVNVKTNSNFTETGLKSNKPKVKAKNVLVVYKFYKMSN